MKNDDQTYSGIFCARFASPTDRIKALSSLKTKIAEVGDKKIWADIDLPAEARACESFLSGLKKILLGWGFDRRCVKWVADGSTKTLKVKGDVKVSVSIRDGRMQYEWEEEWKGKENLHSSPELKKLIEKVDLMLSGDGGKGQGKGKCSFE